MAGETFRKREVEVLHHSELAQLPLASVQRGLGLGVRSLCLVPLLAARGPVGVLKVASRSDHAYAPRDVELLTCAAAAIAPVVDTCLAKESLQTEGQQVQALLNLGLWSGPMGSDPRLQQDANPDRAPESPDLFVLPETLSETERLLREFFAASPGGFCILDRQFRFIMVNRSLAQMDGILVELHLGKTLREVLGKVADTIEPQLERVLATGQPVLNFEVQAVLPARTDESHWLEHYFPIKDTNGLVQRIGMLVVDTTEQKKMEQSLRSLAKSLQQERLQMQALLNISSTLASNRNVHQVFPRISAFLRRVMHQEYASFALHDDERGLLIRQVTDFPLGKGLLPSLEAQVEVAGSPAGKALLASSPMIFSGEEIVAFRTGYTSGLVQEGIKSVCYIPLASSRGTVGTLNLGSTRTDAFRPDDLNLLRQVASQIATALETASATRQIAELKGRMAEERRYLEGEIRTEMHFGEIVGDSAPLKEVLDQVSIVASSDATVLILGETGTGKELIARAIHRMSLRKGSSFIKVHCAAIPTGLLESELFGHEKGAFTGAISQKVGRMELADGGTLFLDEVGEIPLELQPKLLRVLQDHEFERLGSTRTIKVNLRIVAATNRDLGAGIEQGQFRSDLFYRLNVFPIRMPALRERSQDVPLLVRYFVRKYAHALNRHIESIPRETMNALVNWQWPGNVRELENLIERSVILSETVLRVPLQELESGRREAKAPNHTLENAEREHITRVLRETAGILSGPQGAARKLGLKRTTLQSKMARLKITRKDYFGPRPS